MKNGRVQPSFVHRVLRGPTKGHERARHGRANVYKRTTTHTWGGVRVTDSFGGGRMAEDLKYKPLQVFSQILPTETRLFVFICELRFTCEIK